MVNVRKCGNRGIRARTILETVVVHCILVHLGLHTVPMTRVHRLRLQCSDRYRSAPLSLHAMISRRH